MAKPSSKNPLNHLRLSDIRGAAQLATQATAGVTRIAEGVHQSVLGTLGARGGKAPGKTGGITGLVYQTVLGITRLVGKGLDTALAALQPLFDSVEQARPGTPEREAVLAALNGVIGDRLAADQSPFATPMTLRHAGEALDWQALPANLAPTRKVVVLIHGLCMNDLQWHSPPQAGAVEAGSVEAGAADHGAALASALGYTPLYLRYNSGLHVSQNARELSALLEQLVSRWPVPVDDLTVVAHSMGGLLIRAAAHLAARQGARWPERLSNIVFLGTPHHGAPLERAGNWVDVILGSTPYTAPFAKLGQLRSAGITDLRYGLLTDEDWQGRDRFRRKPDNRQIVPLPEGVACYTIAATLAPRRGALADRLIGDGLVPLDSALGQHDEPARKLRFARPSQWIAYRTGHIELLRSNAVTQQMVRWLGS